ncbi:MAG: RsmB/NOP family class I SAM-dependent RNA methyltransferase [Clostridia bacterium]|nr:RsmB/NOP family class I SAM-dependent RNA methyltransferase [Clostridia bacterium]
MKRTYPEAFLKRMETQLGRDYPAFTAALNEPPKKALHINAVKTDRAELSRLLDLPLPVLTENPDGAPVPFDFNPNATPLHAAGLFYMQEATAQAPVAALDLPEAPVVLDLCAAPGGKSAQLAGKAQGGVLFSNEIVPSRADVLAGNLERMGVTNAIITNAEPRPLCEKLKDRCDAVVVDAPCAGEAMFRKDEQAVRDWSLEHVETCAVRQRAILSDAANAVKPGGSLLYATCSFSPQENEETVQWFLAQRADFSLVKMQRLYPHTSAGEGQFYALFAREGVRVPSVFSVGKSDRCPAFESFSEQVRLPKGQLRVLKDGRAVLLPPMPFPFDGVKIVRAGLLLGEVKGSRFEPAHALAVAGRTTPFVRTAALSFDEAMRYLRGEAIPRDAEKGYGAVTYEGHAIGLYKASEGMLKNHYPKGLRLLK